MNTQVLSQAGQLSDQDLVARVKVLAAREREAAATLIAHLAILDERRLYLDEGCSSMFTYCVQVLHLSESATYSRIEAARAVRKYPVILEMLSDGSVNLTTVGLLVPSLTPANSGDLLEAAKHKSKREVQELVAQLRPQPSVPSSIRRLSNKVPASPPAPRDHEISSLLTLSSAAPPAVEAPLSSHRPVVTPLAPHRYKVQFTASAETHAKLQQAQELLRSQIPNGDVGEVIDRALTALLKDLTKRKFAATARKGEEHADRRHQSETDSRRTNSGTANRSRHIPAAVKRKVWTRDGGQCAFVAHDGRRCTERSFLEFHHVVPYGAGGEATVDNIQLRCRAHNGFEAEKFFGRHYYRTRSTCNNQSMLRATGSGPSNDMALQPP